MKKQYLFCCALLLSIPYAQYASAMQGQHNQLNQPVDRNLINQIVNEIQPRQQPTPEEVALFNQAIDSLNQQAQSAQPVQRVNQAQPAQHFEFAQIINQIGRVLSAASPELAQQAQARNQAQPEQQARVEQRRALTQAEQAIVSQIVDDLDSYPNFIQRLHDVGLLEQFLGQAQEQAMPAAQPVVQVEHEQRQQLTDRQSRILDALKRDLSNLDDNNIQIMLIDANTDPLALANYDFMNVLTNEQRALVQEFIAITLDAQGREQQPAPARNVQVVQQEQRGLTQIEYDLVAELAQELAPLERDDIDAVLIQAYTNPYVLAQSRALEEVLNERQKEFINNLLEMYAQRINQQN